MMAAAIDLADHLAQMSPVAVQGTKVNMNYSRDHSVDEGLEYIVRFLRYVYKDGQTLHSQDGLTKGNSYSSNSQRTSFSKRFSASRFPEISLLT